MRLRLALVAGILAGGVLVSSTPAAEPGDLRGVRFEVSAAGPGMAITGRGRLDPDAPAGGGGSVIASRELGGRRETVTLRPATWRVVVESGQSVLEIRVRVTATTAPKRCRIGTAGTLRLVEADRADAVALRFRGSGCRAFRGDWASARGDRARVALELIRRG